MGEKEKISYSDFERLDLRVAEIQNVEDVPGADKLYKLTISVGKEVRTICAGIKEWYSHDDLKGKQIIVLANLESKNIRGINSEGMLLAASSKDRSRVSLIVPDEEMVPGDKVS